MGKIIILDENTANKIAAGEVIEKPASVIKELVENSIDAGATNISVEIRNGGISFIRVIDNGSGFETDDVEIAFERHATSKIRKAEDLESITSMGFRGEALASIAAVSHIQLSTRVKNAVQGVCIEIKGGNVIGLKPVGCAAGTSLTIKELFFNTPARYKFLKKDSTEAGYITDMLSRIALGHPQISFKLVSNGTDVMHTPGNGDLKSAIFSVYGAETARNLIELNYQDEHLKVNGFVGKAEISRSNRNQQLSYINGRIIRSKTITAAIDSAFSTFLMKNRYAFALLNICINPASVDVNVHPSKMEVKFSNEQDIYRAVFHAVNNAMLSKSTVRTLPDFIKTEGGMVDRSAKSSYHLNVSRNTIMPYSQQDFEQVRKELDQKREEAICVTNPIASAYQKSPTSITSAERNLQLIDYEEQPQLQDRGELLAESITETTETKYAAGNKTSITPELDNENRAELAEIDTVRDIPNNIPANIHADNDLQKSSLFEGTRIIGQLFSTYVLLEGKEDLFLLDQHAAHERIRYEELKEAYGRNKPFSQVLMAVIPIELIGIEYQFVIDEVPFFESLGFTYESFGMNSIILRSAPYTGSDINIKEMFLEILDFVMNGSTGEKNIIADEALYRMACKSAVKAHKKLDDREITALIERLAKLDNPYTCPHGRPSILKLRRYELEKLFKRIV